MSKLICNISKVKGRFSSYLGRIDTTGGLKSLIGSLLFGLLYFAFCYIYTLPLYRYDEILDELSSAKKKQAWILYEKYMSGTLK
ncbi:hypothetical protein F0310_04635 (plasmid) [Borrelia sp. A-FGy1]|uniref:hypothetical protein n=1 Tax=Borrelia sp. A-FGy1 TaxID=2608247 RepID=UPI0015F53DE9|nr:hypothetical protein [Borrelia sp. A-FGy1]QMU99704.1 hypothetical protein F0310_04635 [Borrelia sp. A-FGy1]